MTTNFLEIADCKLEVAASGTGPWVSPISFCMDAIRRVFQCLWVRILYLSGALWWVKRDLTRQGAIIVLTFHRVLDDDAMKETDSLPNVVVRQRTFERLARHIAKHYEAVDVRTAAPSVPAANGRPRVAFTFDDGWRDNYVHAFPVMQANRIPGTIFVCTGLVGQHAPFWPERVRCRLRAPLQSRYGKRAENVIEALIEAFKYCPPEARERHLNMLQRQTGQTVTRLPHAGDATLDWDEITEMHRSGIAFGSHSHTHPIFMTIPADQAHNEIWDSTGTLQAMLDEPCQSFAYPNGDWPPEVRDFLIECGYTRAFTTTRDAWLPDADPMAIPRGHVCEEDVTGLTGYFSSAMLDYSTFWKIWLARRRRSRKPVAQPQDPRGLA